MKRMANNNNQNFPAIVSEGDWGKEALEKMHHNALFINISPFFMFFAKTGLSFLRRQKSYNILGPLGFIYMQVFTLPIISLVS